MNAVYQITAKIIVRIGWETLLPSVPKTTCSTKLRNIHLVLRQSLSESDIRDGQTRAIVPVGT